MVLSKKSLRLNFVMNIILTISGFIFPLITFPYASRILLPEGMGKVSFATSIVSYFALFAQLGIPMYGIRICAQVRDNRDELTKTAQELFIINMIISGVVYFVFIGALLAIPRLQEERSLFFVVGSSLLFNAFGVEWLYKALEQYTYITFRSIIFKLVSIVAMVALVKHQNDYVIYGGISIFASSASNIFNFFHAHKYIGFRPVGNYNFKRHLKPVVVFFAMSCATTIYTNLDTVMLGFMKTDVDVGYYTAAVKIKIILVSIVTSLSAILLPRASYYVENDMKVEFQRITCKAVNFVFLIAAPLMIYFMLFAKEGILFLSGDTYSGSILPMQIIMPTLLFIGLSNIMGIQILVPLGREKVVLYSEIAGAVVDLIINWILIPSMASAGAAIGTLVAEEVVTVWQYMSLKDTVTNAYKQVHYVPIALGIALGSLASVWTKMLVWYEFFTLAVSAVIFFAVYGVVLIVAKEPLAMEIMNQVFVKLKNKVKK